MKKIWSIFLIFVLLSMAGCGLNNPDNQGDEGNYVTVIDSRGTELIFDKIPQKIISLMPSNTEILYALGSGTEIIAVSEYCNFPEETNKKDKLPTGEKLSVEEIIALKPDAIFIGNMSVMDDQITQLKEADIKVVVTEANNLSDTYKTIELIGAVMGKEIEASDLIDNMKRGFEDIQEKVAGKTPVSVYVEVSPIQYGLWSCGKNTFVQEILDIIGAKNIFSDIEGWAAVSEEQVLQRNPAMIITTASPLTGIEDPMGEIISRANWGSMDAVKNNKVLMLDADMLTRPGPRLLDAAQELVQSIYP